MSYTLAAAAKATGLKKARIIKAIEEGRIVAWKDEGGEWRIEDAELHSIFPRLAAIDGVEDNEPAVIDAEELSAQIEALLRKAGRRLRQQLDDVRGEAENAHAANELIRSDGYD
jgi:excisionase family DNA binding protein